MAGKETGLRLIIAYKLVRAGVMLALSGILALLTGLGLGRSLHAFAGHLRHHAASAWSIAIADALVGATTRRHLWIAVGALAMDGCFAFAEGWALHKRWRWAPWAVAIATAALVPFEIVALVKRVDGGRVALLALNLVIAGYLLWSACGHGRRRVTSRE